MRGFIKNNAVIRIVLWFSELKKESFDIYRIPQNLKAIGQAFSFKCYEGGLVKFHILL